MPSHYLNQCWPNSLMHICVTRERWVKIYLHFLLFLNTTIPRVVDISLMDDKDLFVGVCLRSTDLTLGRKEFLVTSQIIVIVIITIIIIWVRSRRCGCLVTWFCYRLIAKPGNKIAAPSWPDPYPFLDKGAVHVLSNGVDKGPLMLQLTDHFEDWWKESVISHHK